MGAAAVIALTLTLITIRSLDAPLFLYPSSASLPAGLYMRSFDPVQVGSIVAFPAPVVARHYLARNGWDTAVDNLFIKPVFAGPTDHVCNSLADGLRVNGVWIAPVAAADSGGTALPTWQECRKLSQDEFFVYSAFANNSFDSRYFGIVKRFDIFGAYTLVAEAIANSKDTDGRNLKY
ncbi:MAG: S26 family signal peptidase [Pseudomonadota bacterium]